jgi:hypothetical protein
MIYYLYHIIYYDYNLPREKVRKITYFLAKPLIH